MGKTLDETIRQTLEEMEIENKNESEILGTIYGYEMKIILRKVIGNKFTLISVKSK